MELVDYILSVLSDAPAGLTSSRVVGVGSDGHLYRFPTTQLGLVSASPKATGTSFSLAEIQSGAGFFYTTLPDNCVWTLPTMADLGWTHSATKWLAIPLLQLGLGTLNLNPAVCRSPTGGGTQAQMLALIGVKPGDYFVRSDAGGQVNIYGGGAITSISNWAKTIAAGAANAPTAAGVVINDPMGRSAAMLQQYQQTCLMSCGPDAWMYI